MFVMKKSVKLLLHYYVEEVNMYKKVTFVFIKLV